MVAWIQTCDGGVNKMSLRDKEMEKRRRGRPRLIHTQETVPRRIDTQVSSQAYQKLTTILERRGITLRDWIEWNINGQFMDETQAKYQQLQDEWIKADTKAVELKLKLRALEEEIKNEEKVRKALRVEERYPAAAFRHLLNTIRAKNVKITGVHMKDEMIADRWGIEFDQERLNKDFYEFLVEYDEGLISDEELVKQYSIRKVKPHSFWEKEINESIEKEVGIR